MTPIPFEAIRDAALAQSDRLLREWFPRGTVRGREFVVGNLQGDPGESLSVNLATGKWRDFAADASGHDLIDLHAQRTRCDRVAAARELGEMLGLAANGSRANGHDRPEEKQPGEWCPLVPPPEGTPRPPKSMLAGFDAVYEYCDASDRLLHYIGRIEARGNKPKLFVPLVFGTLDGRPGWHKKHPGAPRPLYGLNRLATMPRASVIVAEGEKAADAAQMLFPDCACVSWQGGAAAIDHADLAPLAGRDVTIWPDNDTAGAKAAEKLRRKLRNARVLRVDDMPESGDAADLITDDPEQWLRSHLPPDEPNADPHGAIRVVNPASLEGKPVPPREWIVEDWLPVGCTTADYGDGGSGKTLLAQQLMTACAAGKSWCGLGVTRCRSIGLFAEDDDAELHRRQDRINGHMGVTYGDLGDMRWSSRVGFDNALATFAPDGRMQATPLFDSFLKIAKEFGARLLVLDTAADLFAGNENDRHQVRQFLGLLNRIALDLNGAVLLNAHPSRAGLNSGTLDGGSTAWSNSVRSRWSLGRPDDDTKADTSERTLTRRKANYASIGNTIRLRWVNGILAPFAEHRGGVFGSIRRRACEEVFLALIDRCEAEGQRLSSSRTAANYGPRLLAERPDAEGYSRKEFDAAMAHLFAANRIALETYGRPGDARQKIARRCPEAPDADSA